MGSLLRLGAVSFEPASLPDVSVVEGALHGIKGEHEVLVMLVRESAAPADAAGGDASDVLLQANAQLCPLEPLSLGGLRLAIKTHRFTGKKVGRRAGGVVCNAGTHQPDTDSRGRWLGPTPL
jgi:hypothetical protein